MKKELFYIVTSFIILALSFSPVTIWAAEDPGAVVVSKIDEGMKILNDPNLKGPEHAEERKQKLWEIVKTVFCFEETSRRALGRYWLKLTPEQRKAFTDKFTKILKDFYLGKTDSYQGEKMVYVRELVEGNRGKVRTNFFTADKKKITVDLSMLKINESWKIYDLIVEGVSVVSNYRNQFNSILAKGSFDTLMKKLDEKEKEILQSKAN